MKFIQYENMKFEEKYVKVGERGQIVIPKSIREREGIKPKQILKIINILGTITVRKVSPSKTPEEVMLEAFLSAGKKAKFTEKDWERIHREREDR